MNYSTLDPNGGWQAIETHYAGCRFRSRLEARWAVFFDALGIDWDYEPQGYVLFGGKGYLPDFHLPRLGVWVEVKGEMTGEALATIVNAVDYGGALPGIANSGDSGRDPRGLLLLGPVPKAGHTSPMHSIFQHREGVTRNLATFTYGGIVVQHDQHSLYWDATGETCIEGDYVNLLTPGLSGAIQPAVAAAYSAARMARFEHGQTPVRG